MGGPDAAHPPLTALVLTPSSYLFGTPSGSTPQRLTMALLGAAVVLCVGLLDRSVASPRVSLIAAGLAACSPNFWLPNAILMSETVSMLLMALILLAVYRMLRAPTWGNAAWLGVAIAAGDGNLLLGANCSRTYSGPNIGTWRFDCLVQIPDGPEPSVLSTRRHQRSVRYIRDHLDRLPLVATARVGRL